MGHRLTQVNTDKARRYPVLCAWCEKEGRRVVINRSSVPNSHGICPMHAEELTEEARNVARALCRDIAEQIEPGVKKGETANGVEAY